MSVDPVKEFLRFLTTHAIRVRDFDELRTKIVKIKTEGLEQFQVVSDFDKTMTPQWLRDPCSKTGALITCHSSYSIIEHGDSVSEKYRKRCRELADQYIPLENDHRLSPEERVKMNWEWHTQGHASMLEENLNRESLKKIVHDSWKSMQIHLRDNTRDFFKLLEKNRVPTTVLSAGLRDVIETILVLEDILSEISDQTDEEIDHLLMIVGNRLEFDINGKHVGFSKPAILPHNKKDAVAQLLRKSAIRTVRPNALLLGDFPHDVDFVHLIPNLDEYVAIGFLADRPHDDGAALNEYLKHFDIVVTGGHASMQVAVEFLKCLEHR